MIDDHGYDGNEQWESELMLKDKGWSLTNMKRITDDMHLTTTPIIIKHDKVKENYKPEKNKIPILNTWEYLENAGESESEDEGGNEDI